MSYKWNPFTGTLDYFDDQATGSDDAKRLTDLKTCAVDISALQLVKAINDSEIAIATPDDFSNAKVLGMALTAGTTGNQIEILLFGKLEDPFFNFTVNQPLFLKDNGVTSNVAPTLPTENFNTTIGHSLGTGAIFLNIQEPIEL
jgi:hypothetical protein